MVERFNRILKCMLNKYVGKYLKDWDLYLFLLMLVYRFLIYESIGEFFSLFMLGREVEFFVDLLYGCYDIFRFFVDFYNGYIYEF